MQLRPATDRPFPNWDLIYSRDAGANSIYNAFEAELNRRYASRLTFSTAYTRASIWPLMRVPIRRAMPTRLTAAALPTRSTAEGTAAMSMPHAGIGR